jgi:hypothetical protein
MEVPQGNSLGSYVKQPKNVIFFFFIQNQRIVEWNRSYLKKLLPMGQGGGWEMVKDGEYGANIVYIYINGKKKYVLKLFQEWGGGWYDGKWWRGCIQVQYI